MKFNWVAGQDATKEGLRKLVEENKIPHALMLLGNEGVGQLALSIAFAGYIFCNQRTSEDRCGTCPSCKKVNQLIHPDLHFSFPFAGSKEVSDHFLPKWRTMMMERNGYFSFNDWMRALEVENKQGNINKDECVNILKKLSLKTFEGPKKIMIIWLPEYLGNEANRLLKLIEEPPDNTVFILATENSEAILPTILSRCQLFKLNPVRVEDVFDKLKLYYPEEQGGKLKSAAMRSEGKLSQALKIVKQEVDNVDSFFLDWFRKCYKGNGIELVEWVDVFIKHGREEQKRFFKYGLHFTRELMLYFCGMEGLNMASEGEEKVFEKMVENGIIDLDKIDLISGLFSETSYSIERNANPKILFLDVSIALHEILRNSRRNSA